jgi:sulfide:quinone oxidoreductase
MARILILGGGFAGLTAAEKLADSLGSESQITLVSARPEFIFYPALTHVAFGNLQSEEIKFDLRAKLNDLEVRFVEGEVLDVNASNQTVKIYGEDFSGEIHYDYLLVAVGRRLATEKVGGFFEFANHLLGVNAALKFKKEIENFKRGKIVVGLCPEARLPVPIYETSIALAEKFKKEIAAQEISVSVIFPETIEKAFGNAEIYRKIQADLIERKIKIIENFPVDDISKTQISAQDKSLDYNLLMLLPPFRGQAMLNHLHDSVDKESYCKVNRLMQVGNLEHVYAAGDIIALTGPKFASTAISQTQVAAANIISEIAGYEPRAEYTHNIAKFLDEGGADSVYHNYGIWNESLYQTKSETLSNWAKYIHERLQKLPY